MRALRLKEDTVDIVPDPDLDPDHPADAEIEDLALLEEVDWMMRLSFTKFTTVQ